MRQAITTKFLGPTNSRGSRVKALARKAEAVTYSNELSGPALPELSLTLHWAHELGIEANHCRAAKALAAKLGWSGLWIAGHNPNGEGYVFVALDGSFSDEFAAKYLFRENLDWFMVKGAGND